MRRIDTADSVDGRFDDGNELAGREGTVVDAAWLNSQQEELAGVVEGFGSALDPADSSQVYKAINAAIDARILAADKQRWRIGSVYINADDDTNPAIFFGFGTWVLTSKGRMIAGYDSGDSANNFRPIGKTSGSVSHRLSYAELPRFRVPIPSTTVAAQTDNGNVRSDADGGGAGQTYSEYVGGYSSFSLLNPYIVMYIWKRTA